MWLRLLLSCQQVFLIALLGCRFTDAAPTFVGLPGATDTVTISEAATVNSLVYTLTASASSSWSIDSSSSSNCPSGSRLALSAASGVTTVNLVVGATRLDYETTTLHICMIVANDGTGSRTATITVSVVNVWDVAPSTSPSSKTGSVQEEQSIGTSVIDSTSAQLSFTFTDSEVGNGASDVLTCGLSGANSGLFTVTTAATSGGCTCSITTNARIDRESLTANPLVNILVTATDKGGLVGTATMTVSIIDINDNSPVCTTMVYSDTVAENIASKTIATIATCTDADEGVNAALVYGFVTAPAGFSLSSNVVSLSAAQDYDTLSVNPVVFYVFVRDSAASGQRTITTTLTVTVTGINDNTPAFSSLSPGLTATYAESASIGSTMFSQSATDGDKAGEPDSTLTWSIVQAQTTTPAGTSVTSQFTIDSSGAVKLGTTPLDFETWRVCEIVVKVQDQGTNPSVLSSTRTLTLSVTDVNEFPPSFSPSNYYKVSLTENNVENFTVLNTFSYTDPDGSKLPVWCEIASGNTGSVFRFNTTNRNVLELATTIEPDKTVNHPLIFTMHVMTRDNVLYCRMKVDEIVAG